ncbi:hypothetical protein UJ101_01936 [Flavobacteriaceae bacterium UJ101]|nr:hypothetical protein UJ101_01936 [Flavobacteriaceae bacterium UJ101]
MYFCRNLNQKELSTPKKYQFIIQLGKALHRYGVPSYKIESFLKKVSERQEITGTFMDLPTSINYIFYENHDQNTYSYVERVAPGVFNLGALANSVEVARNLLDNKITIDDAKSQLLAIKKRPNDYHPTFQIFSFGIAASAFNLLMGTNWISFIVSFFVGIIIGFITHFARRSNYITSTLESLASFTATIIIGLLSVPFPEINISLTILASIIIFIPGLSITTALEEITSKSLVSGTAKLADAIISLFKQFFGVILGLQLLPLIIEVPHHDIINNIPKWISYCAIPLFSLTLIPLFNVRKKDIVFSILVSSLSFATIYLLAPLGILLSTFLGTITTVMLSTIVKNITHTPRIVFLTQGIITLVPGSKTFIGLSSVFLHESTSNNVNMVEQVTFILMGIIGGLIFSGAFKDTKS